LCRDRCTAFGAWRASRPQDLVAAGASVPRAYCGDRLAKMVGGGLNTVMTYVPWTRRQPEPAHWDFDGNLDVVTIIKARWRCRCAR
jgi:hypothetical protein